MTAFPVGRRLSRAAALVAILVCAYAVLGFFAAPALLRHAIQERGSAALHRDVHVANVRVNPFALSLRIEGFEVRDRSGAPFAAWESLYVRAAPWRIFTGDIGIAEVRLVRPSLHGGIDAAGSLSFADLLSPDSSTSAAAPEEKRSRFGLYVGSLAVDEARISFHDATRRPAFDTALGPVTFRLDGVRTKGGRDSPYSLTGATESGESFRWTGTIGVHPLRSSGMLAFERIKLSKYGPYLRDEVPVALRDGFVDLETRYELEWSAVRHLFRTSAGKVTVRQLALAPLDAQDDPVRLSRVDVTGVELNASMREAKVSAVEVRGGTVRIRRESDGRLELARMAPPPAPKPASPAWAWSVDALSVSRLAVAVDDRVPERPVVVPITDLQLRVTGLRPREDVRCPVESSLTWHGGGRVALRGSVQPFGARGTLDVDVADLDVAPLGPYLENATTAQLTGGRASAKARVNFDASGPTPRWGFTGDFRLDAVSVAEKGNDDLLGWRAVELTGIDATAVPARASVRLIRIVEPRLKAYVWEDGTTSFARARSTAHRAAPADTHPANPAPDWRTTIAAIQVVRGRVAFVDRTVRPPAVLNLTGAGVKVTNLSSDPKVRSTVDARLDVEGVSPIRVTGTLNPLQKAAYTKLSVASHGVDLSPLDPYAAKFLGYGLRKGKLDLDLRYEIEHRKLAATNVVKLDQLTLGDASHSPEATKVPVRLALALLQDRDGVILLDVPVEGDLDDPDFHLGKVIWRAILNVLVKVATSPFSALASLVGGSHADLSVAEFLPGVAEPTPAAQESFALLAKSLAQRPAVGLELEGSVDPARDGPALQRARLETMLRQAKAAAMRPAPAAIDALPLTPDERQRLVSRAYEAASAKTRADGKTKEGAPVPTAKEMEDRLAASIDIPPDAYRALAAERAQRAREALIAAGIDQGRLFLVEGGGAERPVKRACVNFTAK